MPRRRALLCCRRQVGGVSLGVVGGGVAIPIRLPLRAWASSFEASRSLLAFACFDGCDLFFSSSMRSISFSLKRSRSQRESLRKVVFTHPKPRSDLMVGASFDSLEGVGPN